MAVKIKSVTLEFQRFYHDSGRAILIGYNNNKHWIPKSHFIYKKHTGKEVPKGMVLYFVDGNYLNFDIKNLAFFCVQLLFYIWLSTSLLSLF